MRGGGADCEVGEWRRERGEETEEEVGKKKVKRFWTGARGAGGCRFEVDGAVRQLLDRVHVPPWLVG
jgi:hypothetical protein